MSRPLWDPSADRIAASAMERFRRRVEASGVSAPDSVELHRWSVDDPTAFWSAAWDDLGVLGEKGDRIIETGEDMAGTRFFPDARISVVENLLDGRGAPDDAPAIEYRREDGVSRTLTWAGLREEVAAFAAALAGQGVGEGDVVAAWMPHVPETIIAMLGSASLGALFTSTSSDFGTAGVVDRFGQVEPSVLVAADSYLYGGKSFDRTEALAEIRAALPSLRALVVVSPLEPRPIDAIDDATSWDEFTGPHAGAALVVERRPFDHPWYVLYSSGTTGKPKCMIHRTGGVLLKHLQEQQHQCDVRAGDRLFYFTTCGWMMWNWLVSGLASGATVVLYDGNPAHPGPEALFDLADELDLTLMGVSAKYIDAISKSGLRPVESHRLGSLRTIASTGSPLSPDGFRFVYDDIKSDVHLASVSGGTDLCGCLVGGDPTRPVFEGEIQGACLGMDIQVYDDSGSPAGVGEQGELVCAAPFPSMPITFWGDGGDDRYRAAYFEHFPGVWTHGDWTLRTVRGGFVILGRSDATLNAGGVRIGTAEVYRVVEQFDEVAEAVAVAQRVGTDSRVVLFLRMAEGASLHDDLAERIRRRLRSEESPRHVPAVMTTVGDIPRTRSGKISELAVTAVVNGDPVRNTEALANPEALALFADRPELAR